MPKKQDLFHRMVFKMFLGILMDTIESHQFCLICGFSLLRSPDTARVRSKMIYASSKDRFKRELDGIQIELQATDPTEMELDVIKSRAN